MPSKKALYDIPSLPDTFVSQKYLPTSNAYYDPNTVSNFMKEMIRNTGSDKPLFEDELPRQSGHVAGRALLSMQEHGSRYARDPYHPELFLGDLTKDQRMSSIEPRTSQMVQQNKFRQEKYIVGKLQDVGDVRAEGVIGTKRMIRQIKQGLNDTATRMSGIFEDSTGNVVNRAPHAGNSTHKVGAVVYEDQAIYQVKDEKILPRYGTDIVNKLSNMIGVQWDVQPDTKYKLSSVSNVYRSKQEVDQAANAVFRLGNQETAFKTETTDIQSGTLVPTIESFKQARKDRQSIVTANQKDSVKTNRIAALLPSLQMSRVDNFVSGHSVKPQMKHMIHSVQHNKGGNKLSESLVEPITSNNTLVDTITTAMPTKDKLRIVRFVNRTQASTSSKEGYSNNRASMKALANAFTKKPNTIQQQKTKDVNTSVRYVNGMPVKAVDHISNNRMTKSKFGNIKEHLATNQTGSNVLPTPADVSSFKFDTDPTMDNNYITRRGLTGKGQQNKIQSQKEYDNEVSPLSDTITPYRTKY